MRSLSKFAIPGAAIAVLLSPLAGAATDLGPRYEAVSRLVKFADLDLDNPKAVATLYQRISSAAERVCEPIDAPIIETYVHIRNCERQAIARAVKDVNSSSLTSFHRAATNQTEFTAAAR